MLLPSVPRTCGVKFIGVYSVWSGSRPSGPGDAPMYVSRDSMIYPDFTRAPYPAGRDGSTLLPRTGVPEGSTGRRGDFRPRDRSIDSTNLGRSPPTSYPSSGRVAEPEERVSTLTHRLRAPDTGTFHVVGSSEEVYENTRPDTPVESTLPDGSMSLRLRGEEASG